MFITFDHDDHLQDIAALMPAALPVLASVLTVQVPDLIWSVIIIIMIAKHHYLISNHHNYDLQLSWYLPDQWSSSSFWSAIVLIIRMILISSIVLIIIIIMIILIIIIIIITLIIVIIIITLIVIIIIITLIITMLVDHGDHFKWFTYCTHGSWRWWN